MVLRLGTAMQQVERLELMVLGVLVVLVMRLVVAVWLEFVWLEFASQDEDPAQEQQPLPVEREKSPVELPFPVMATQVLECRLCGQEWAKLVTLA